MKEDRLLFWVVWTTAMLCILLGGWYAILGILVYTMVTGILVGKCSIVEDKETKIVKTDERYGKGIT